MDRTAGWQPLWQQIVRHGGLVRSDGRLPGIPARVHIDGLG
jgi:hypothetical protein